MNPGATRLWHRPRWMLAALLAGLGMVGPFSIDTYLPAFAGIAASLHATPAEMQQTLSVYLFGFAAMNLFHGAISDSVGRRPVVLAGLAVFTLASLGCALSESIGALLVFRALQGVSAGAGIVVSRAIVRDVYRPEDAQRVMSLVTIFFGLAPAVAPMVGGWLFVRAGWHAIFWLLVVTGTVLFVLNARLLPESLPPAQRHAFAPGPLLHGYGRMLSHPRFVALVIASGIPFNGLFLYVLSAPAWLGELLNLPPTQFFWFFLLSIGGIMSGAWVSGRLAGRMPARRQIRRGFQIMAATALVNVALNAALQPQASWALLPISLYAFGWALMVPVVTLMVLDVVPDRRGMASSLQACIGSASNGVVAGVVAPLVMHSPLALALTSLAMLGIGLAAWRWARRHDAG
jgi:DHA1 family bicyclomycin/chloramphenicol resistance-like MFS transporter